MVFEALGLGALGGAARAAVGLLKAIRKEEKIHWGYASLTVVASAIIGAAAGILFDSDPKLMVIAGYVGTDVLENSYKIIFNKAPVASL